jgi:hypothetical protein
MNVTGPPGIVVIAPGIRARIDRDEAVPPFLVGYGIATPGKVQIQRSVVLVNIMKISARCVGLPDLNQSSALGPVVLVQNSSTHNNSLADRLAGTLAGQVVRPHISYSSRTDRSRSLTERLG